ncbi:MAG: hypothetical protein ACRDF4_04115, partial [Rhabdochlamydiaceae bacterium]
MHEYQHDNRRLIVGYSESRAVKDKGDRDRLVAKMRTKLGKMGIAATRKFVTNTGYLKFVDEQNVGTVTLDEDKIAGEARWDGLHGII